ncbi:hypothetical protein, partial [uncultured Dubosiella sp.]|uniref:hypothetical protein n=1 Tax=uncultured Dubosiella sp. TaxID=1937011 RepID=UPI00259A668D
EPMVLHLHIPHKIDLFSYPKLYIGEEFPNKKRKKTVIRPFPKIKQELRPLPPQRNKLFTTL